MTNALTIEELNQHYAILAAEYGVMLNYARNRDGMCIEQDVDFLNEMIPLVDQDTPDSRSMVEHIIQHASEEAIREILAFQQHVAGASYNSVKAFYGAFRKYIGKGMLRKPKKLLADVNKLVALYRVTEALMKIQTATTPYPERALDNEYDIYWIKDVTLLNFVLENYEHWETIVAAIRAGGVVRVPALEFMINGGPSAITTGAL
jgi:hypothetical protein